MKNKISALMDGELESKDVADIISQVYKKEELRNEWSTYHLIGDTLRQPEISTIDVVTSVRKELSVEPTVITQELPKEDEDKGKTFTFAIAASMVTAVAAVAWMGSQAVDQPLKHITNKVVVHTATTKNKPVNDAPIMPVLAKEDKFKPNQSVIQSAAQSGSAVIPIPTPIHLNDYLFVHEEFSPRSAISGMPPYVRTVADPYKRPVNR